MKSRDKKIQITLLLIGLILIITTYFYYPYSKKVKLSKNQPMQENIENISEDPQGNSFENVEYKGLYDLDKPFSVKSDKAHILIDEPDIMYMTNMHVVLNLSDGRVVNIMSDKGRYNKITYDCFFEVNVRASDGETKIFAENLDLLATNNIVEIYNNVTLYYPTGSLWADRIDYDFETKNFKVSMFDDSSVKMKVIKSN